MSNVYTVTHVEHGWDCILECFSSEEDAKEYVEWYCSDGNSNDCLIIHKNKLHECFTKEGFE